MATLDYAAAHTLLARWPARERAEQQRRVELHDDEEDEAEQERQRMLLVELEKYEEQNDTLRQQLKRVR